ncbi:MULTISPECIES: hypothetical protein [Halobacillus]|uniref:hypothetical protein n=1 Tax=Halobacillus TaxID=45667 RepID=UPI0009A7E09A|nr:MULTISPECIES: hypothetical protein [Halobacillus]
MDKYSIFNCLDLIRKNRYVLKETKTPSPEGDVIMLIDDQLKVYISNQLGIEDDLMIGKMIDIYLEDKPFNYEGYSVSIDTDGFIQFLKGNSNNPLQ